MRDPFIALIRFLLIIFDLSCNVNTYPLYVLVGWPLLSRPTTTRVGPAEESPPAASRPPSYTRLPYRRRSAPHSSEASEPFSAGSSTHRFKDVEPCDTGLHRYLY